jgi:small-conductance mechanosensitive channel
MEIIKIKDLIALVASFLRDEATSIVVMIVGLFFLAKLLTKLANQFVHEDRRRFKFKKSIKYFTSFIAIFWVIVLYNSHIERGQPLYLFIIGTTLATIAIGMRDLITNVVGWMIIASHKGFQTGDRIEIDDIRGDVIDIGILRTNIAEIGEWHQQGEQSTGRLLSIPNSKILTGNIINYNRGGYDTMWNEISVAVTFESNWEEAERIVADIAEIDFESKKSSFADKMKSVKRNYMVKYNYISPKVYVTIMESGVQLTLRHMVSVRQRRMVADELNRQILKAFTKSANIEFAYPTIRYFKGPETVK